MFWSGRPRVRRQILERLFARPGVVGHVRELARELDRSPTIVGAELERLRDVGDRFIETVFAGSRVLLVPRRPVAE